jgi:adenylate cyclase
VAANAQTFLFADLAGFTALTEAHGDERAAELVDAFCSQARALLPEHSAQEVKAIGDALMIRAADAAHAVRLAQRLATEIGGRHGFPGVRVGLHTGPAVERGRDWFGSTVNLAARVSSAASAGDVLVTDATRSEAAEALPDLEFRRMGPQRFKNVSRPVEVFRVTRRGQLVPRNMAVDPVCRMAVDPARAAVGRHHRGHEYHFCSEACALTFDDAPGRFVGRRRAAGELRASDDVRERGVKLLRTSYARGRLTTEELEERTEHVYAARTRDELRSVLRDLPEYRRWRARMRRRRWWRALIPRWLRRRGVG